MVDDHTKSGTQSLMPPFTAYHGDEPYIFVSYSHKDKVVVYPELVRLHDAGYRIWYDEGIIPGEEWTENIEMALIKCSIFLVFLSPNAMESENVKDEVHVAAEYKKKRLAIYLKETVLPVSQNLRMSRIQAIYKYDLTDTVFWHKMREALPDITRIADEIVSSNPISVNTQSSDIKNITPELLLTPDSSLQNNTDRPDSENHNVAKTLKMIFPLRNKRFVSFAIIVVVLTLVAWWIVDIKKQSLAILEKGKSFSIPTSVVKVKTNSKDDAIMAYIPAGDFLMGSKDGVGNADENPQHKVYLSGYWIYKNEVTVAEYRRFCLATGRKMVTEPSWKWQDDHPIVNVSWENASAYAKWAGASLPTEAQWEKAARGTDTRIYPWGNEWDGLKCVNSSQSTKPIGSIQSENSPYSCRDLAGNVTEWCSDWYDAEYYKNTPKNNPKGPTHGTSRVLRGGGWCDDNPNFFRVSYRRHFNPGYGRYYFGFRCTINSSDK